MDYLSPTSSTMGCLVEYLSVWFSLPSLIASFWESVPQVLGCLSTIITFERNSFLRETSLNLSLHNQLANVGQVYP